MGLGDHAARLAAAFGAAKPSPFALRAAGFMLVAAVSAAGMNACAWQSRADMTRESEELTSVSQQAAHWWVGLHNMDASATEKREFVEWVARAPERVEACLRVARVHAAVSRADVRCPRTSAEELVRNAIVNGIPLAHDGRW